MSGNTVYAGGQFTSIGGQPRNYIAAIDASTGLATTWDPNASSYVRALAVSGNTVYAGGDFTIIGGQARNHIAALDATNGLANAWNPNASDDVHALAVSGNTVYAGGQFTSTGGQARNNIAALDASSGLVTAWGPNADGPVNALAGNGMTIYVGGAFSTIGGQARNNIAALNVTTGAATAWNPNSNGEVRAIAESGSTLYVSGNFTSIGGQARNHIAALDATSGQATAWNPSPVGGPIVVSGSTVYVGGGGVTALDATTGATVWASPAGSGDIGPGSVSALAVVGTSVIAGGIFEVIGGQLRSNMAALNAATGAVTSWNPNPNDAVFSLAASGNIVYVGGQFTSIGGQARRSIAALDSDFSLIATDWDPNAGVVGNRPPAVRALAFSGTTVYAGGDFKSMRNLPQCYVTAISVSTTDVPDPARTGSVALLRQNAPNPFGGSTLIGFSLVAAEQVTVKVYDLAGRELATLVQNERRGPGPHQVEFRGGLADGVYLYRLQAGHTVETRKMVVCR